MKTYEIDGSTGHSTILIGEALTNLRKYLPEGKVVVITDENVWHYYGDIFPKVEVIRIGIGEPVKSMTTMKDIFTRLIELNADRSSFIVGIGGGVVCDITGFVASTYMRGIRFGYVATSLLAQVDASVGGKNGVNIGGYKNIIGTFNQPDFVLCDPAVLETLPKKEILCGLAEIIKHALIRDADLFDFLEDNVEKILALDIAAIERLVIDSVDLKAAVVNQDEREEGLRKILNYGHTFGHALEKILQVSHGEAVSAGMVIATDISVKKGYLPTFEAERAKRLIDRYNLPMRFSVDRKQVFDAMRKDKKKQNDIIHFILLRGIGSAVVDEMTLSELEELAADLLG
jgi:3-dehydroquinate synthase